MSDTIGPIRVEIRSLSPAEADLILQVEAVPAPVGDLRGKLTGPRCRYASTVEVAYPLRPHGPAGLGTLRCLVPEPNLWEPQCPFLYEAQVDLWRQETRLGQETFRLGLRSFRIGVPGFRLNGRPFSLNGAARANLVEADLAALRAAGIDTLLTSVENEALWTWADELGFLMIGRVGATPAARQALRNLTMRRHPSALAWLLPEESLGEGRFEEMLDLAEVLRLAETAAVGVELRQIPLGPLPRGLAFVACPEALLPFVTGLSLPALLLRKADETPGAVGPGLLGQVVE